MRAFFTLLLICAFVLSCKKKSTTAAPSPSPTSSTTYCDSIYCLQANANAQYTYCPQPNGVDTNMTGHEFRMLYTHSDSTYSIQFNKWIVYMHYVMKNATFDTSKFNPQCLIWTQQKGSGNGQLSLQTKWGNYAVFKISHYYH